MTDQEQWATPAPKPGEIFSAEADVGRLRADYVGATPKQRLGVIVDRLTDQNIGPNLVVTLVSAVEAFARCAIVASAANASGNAQSAVYPKYRDARPEALVGEYLAMRGTTPRSAFEEPIWNGFLQAVKYRDLLVHECTYLRMEKLEEINSASKSVLEKLVELEGLTDKYQQLLSGAALAR